MGNAFEDLLSGWDGEEVVVRHDEASATWIFVGVHSTALGPAFGGTRMKVYDRPADGLGDVLRLSAAMTAKNALAGLPFGGGKAVLAVPQVPTGDARREVLLRYADVVAALGGTYRTACDMNTTAPDMDVVAERCPHVFGRTEGAGGSGGSGPSTAVGVYHGIQASVAHVFGSDDLSGRSVLVQGVGSVGSVLARRLLADGARVLVSDLDPDRVAALSGDAETVDPPDVYGTECDVFAPCATGGVLNAETIPRLRCRIVAGAANNQLATAEDGARLHAAGILYAPDYAVNSGGVLHLAGLEALGWSRSDLATRLAGIGDTLAEILAEAEAEGITPAGAAEALVRRRLAAPRAG